MPRQPKDEALQWQHNAFGDVYLPTVNGIAFNQAGAMSLLQAQFAPMLSRPNTGTLLIGTDSGLLIQLLCQCLATHPQPDNVYVFVEHPQVIEALASRDFMQTLPDQISVLNPQQFENQIMQSALANYVQLDRWQVIKSIGVLDANFAGYHGFASAIEACWQQCVWELRIGFSGKTFIDQQLKNLPEYQHNVTALAGCLKGKTAIVLGGGPSLDECLPWIMAHREQLMVIAVSRIAARLQQVDLCPDVVVAIDPTEKMFTVSRAMFSWNEPPLLVAAYHVSAQIAGNWRGPLCFIGPRYPWQAVTQPDQVTLGPTVSNTAVDLAVYLGATQVLLAGLDLCYSREGYSHAKGSAERLRGPDLSYQGVEVVRYDGETAITEPAFFAALNALEKQAEYAQAQGCQLIQLSKQAAKLSNIEQRCAEQIQLSSSPCLLKFEEILTPLTCEQTKNHFKNLQQELNEAKQALRRLAEQATAIKQQFAKLKRSAHSKQLVKCQQQEAAFYRSHQSLLEIIKLYRFDYFMKVFQQATTDLTEQQASLAASEILYHAYGRAARSLQQAIAEAEQRIAMRQEEWQSQPHWEKLTAQWLADKQGNRVHAYLARRQISLGELPQEGIALCWQASEAFLAQRDAYQPLPLIDCQSYEVFARLKQKLYQAMRLAQDDVLLSYQVYLTSATVKPSEAQQALLALTLAFIAQRQGQLEQANEAFYQAAAIVLPWPQLAELALNYLAENLLTLGDLTNAMTTFDCLVALDSRYYLQQAKCLEAMNDWQGAEQAYQAYLCHFPQDKEVQSCLHACQKQRVTES